MDENTSIRIKELPRERFTHKDALRAIRIWSVTHTDEGGYVNQDFTIHIFADGLTISANDGDGFVSLHGDIAKAFYELTKEAPPIP